MQTRKNNISRRDAERITPKVIERVLDHLNTHGGESFTCPKCNRQFIMQNGDVVTLIQQVADHIGLGITLFKTSESEDDDSTTFLISAAHNEDLN